MKTNRYSLLSLLAALLLSTACTGRHATDNGETEAARLLEQVRIAAEREDFDRAHRLVDSIRHTYPLAVDVRRHLLTYVDTLSLLEARVQSALAGDSLTWAEAAVASLEAAGVPPTDSRLKEAYAQADTLRQRAQRMHMKVRFFERKLQENHLNN